MNLLGAHQDEVEAVVLVGDVRDARDGGGPARIEGGRGGRGAVEAAEGASGLDVEAVVAGVVAQGRERA
ncbi:hypothetical protein D3C72_2322300 [compost metagenome]